MQYYESLPVEYDVKFRIDSNNKRTSLKFSVWGIIITISIVIILLIIKHEAIILEFSFKTLLWIFIFGLILIINVLLHELMHGLFYKLFTHKKLKIGFSITNAYCGVPSIYVKKRPMIIISLAPFVFFSSIAILLSLIES